MSRFNFNLFNSIRSFFQGPRVELAQGEGRQSAKGGWQPKLKRYWQPRIELALKQWKLAVAAAEDVIRPRRELLYMLYHSVMEDDHLLGQVRTARFIVQLSDFRLERDGKPFSDKEQQAVKKLFQKPWFNEYLEKEVDTELYGHTLLEFNPEMVDGEFQSIWMVPREHVRPETGELVINVHDEKGLDYRDPKIVGKFLVEIGRPDDLGLLKSLARLVIQKSDSMSDWSTRNEKYGMPFLVVKTATRDEKELDKKAEMAANFGNNGWAILDDMDIIDFKESNQSFAYKTYSDLWNQCDSAISRLVNGQSGTTEEKAFVGSAEVHERILNDYTKARLRRIEYNINFRLIPFLAGHGYPLDGGVNLKFRDLKEKPAPMDGTMDTPVDDNDDRPGAAGQKKKPGNRDEGRGMRNQALSLLYADVEPCCDHSSLNPHPSSLVKLSLDLDAVVSKAIRNVFDKKVKAGDLDAGSWQFFFDSIWSEFQKGAGGTLVKTEYTDPTYELLAQFRQNIFVFSAFKNHAAITDLVDALTDPSTGKLREWNAYKAAVAPITGNYFEDWLQAEWQTAHATADNAVRWQDFQANKDTLPMLRYVTQNDARVRPSHKVLHGVTMHIDDPFWDTWYPPNGWSCRCLTQQTSGDEVPPTLEPNEQQTPPLFRFNSAKTKELFPQSHPYFQTVPERQRQRLVKATSHLVYDNYYGDDWKKIDFDEGSGGYVVMHKGHAGHEAAANTEVARRLMAMGDAVELVENRPGEPSPDLLRNGLLWEVKQTSGSASSVQNRIRKGKGQASKVLLVIPKDARMGEIIKGMMSAINLDEKGKVERVALLFTKGTGEPDDLVELTAEDIRKRRFGKLKKYLP